MKNWSSKREGGFHAFFKYGDNMAHFQFLLKEINSLHSSHKKWKKSSCVRMKNESWREKFKPWLFSHLCTVGQSLREVGVNAR